jgi:hypothetical protein
MGMREDERLDREKERLVLEARIASTLTDADRIRILRDLLRTAEAIRRTKSPDELRREEEARRVLDGEGLRRYADLAGRLG